MAILGRLIMVAGAYPRRPAAWQARARAIPSHPWPSTSTRSSRGPTPSSPTSRAPKALVESTPNAEARRLAAGALGYLVTRLDLVPDWEGGIGALDDVMVLRVCAQLAAGHGLSAVAEPHEITLARMANEAERISRVPRHRRPTTTCASYAGQAVDHRGARPGTPATILAAEAAARAALYAEVDDEIKKTVPVVIKDAEDAELRFKAYLTHKLK
jgi:uncharacterized membrane protein YkvA (DUF1232 family)